MPAIYQPTPAEITPLMQRARTAWPHMADAVDRAAAILLAGSITTSGSHFLVDSQSNPTQIYSVETTSQNRRASCTCTNFETGGYIADGRRFCKHTIAVVAYIEILRQQLLPRVCGDSNSRAVRQKLAAHHRIYLMHVSNTTTITNIERDRIFFSITWANAPGRRAKLTFASAADAITFAHWLHRAEPLPPAPAIDRYDEAMAKQQAAAEWKVDLTPDQLRRWYDTGSVV